MDDYSTLYPPQNPMGQFLNDPGMAMAGSAINNMMQMRRGMAPQSNPFQVLQEQQRRNAILQNQRYQQIEQKKLRDLQRAQIMHNMMKAPKESAFMEQAKFYADSVGIDTAQQGWNRHPEMVSWLQDRGNGIDVDVNLPSPQAEIAAMGGFDEKAAKDTFRANLEGLPTLLGIGSQFDPEYLTTGGQLYQKYSGMKDRAGLNLSGDESASLRDYTQFRNNVEQYFNSYRKMITGAAASEREMESLRESIFNMDQGPVAFQASLDNMMESMAKQVRGAIYLQATGVAEMGTEQMGKEIEKRSAARFASDDHLEVIADYIATTMGIDEETASPEQLKYINDHLKSMGFAIGE